MSISDEADIIMLIADLMIRSSALSTFKHFFSLASSLLRLLRHQDINIIISMRRKSTKAQHKYEHSLDTLLRYNLDSFPEANRLLMSIAFDYLSSSVWWMWKHVIMQKPLTIHRLQALSGSRIAWNPSRVGRDEMEKHRTPNIIEVLRYIHLEHKGAKIP